MRTTTAHPEGSEGSAWWMIGDDKRRSLKSRELLMLRLQLLRILSLMAKLI